MGQKNICVAHGLKIAPDAEWIKSRKRLHDVEKSHVMSSVSKKLSLGVSQPMQ